MFCQFYVGDKNLSCQMYQTSADMGLGVPFNVAPYSLLTHMVAQCCDLEAAEFMHIIGDAHVYKTHVGLLRGTAHEERDEGSHDKIESCGEEHGRL